MSALSFKLLRALITFSLFFAQSYADNVPTVYEGTYTNMSMGKSSILNYYISSDRDFTVVTRAVISVHGLYRDPWNYFNSVNYAVNEAWNVGADPNSIVLMTPFFPNGNDKATATGTNARDIFNSTNQLCWSSDLWAQGAPATLSRKSVDQTFTSHQALDALINFFANKTAFPKMKEVVLFGHSAGAQLVQSYSVVGNPVLSPLALRLVIGAPGTYVWLNSSRPIDTSSCPTYNDYNYGLDNFTYKSVKPTFPNAKFEALDIIYNYGSSDDDPNFVPADPGCEVQTQGNSHATRMQNYWASLLGMYGNGIRTFQRLTVTPGGDHSSYANQYIQWLSLFTPISATGYPVIESNATFEGCYVDAASNRVLPGPSFTSNSMDIDTCVNFCNTQGYPYAGVEWGQECYCGDAVPTVSTGAECNIPCFNNFNEYCGGVGAISVYATNTTVTRFNSTSLGCFEDFYPNYRALPNASTTNSKMTSQLCGEFCSEQGYLYYGTEYSDECYCGNDISNLVSLSSSSCDYTCAGWSSEICGGSNALSLYSASLANVTSSSTTSSSATSSTASSSSSSASSTSSSSVSATSTTTASAGTSSSSSASTFSTLTVTPTTTSSSSSSSVPSASSTTTSASTTLSSSSSSSSTSSSSTSSSSSTTPSSSSSSTSMTSSSSTTSSSSSSSSSMTSSSSTTSTASSSTSSVTSSSSTTSTSSSASATASLSATCLTDAYPNARTLDTASFTSNVMTNELCQNYCFAANYLYSGTEYSDECYCSQTINTASGAGIASTGCTMPCAGNSSEICGGSNAISVFTNPNPPVEQYTNVGCQSDGYPNARYLNGPNYWASTMTPQICLNYCFSYGQKYAGLEDGYQCFCGSTLNSNSVSLAASSCANGCQGDYSQLCGGSNTLQVYVNSAMH